MKKLILPFLLAFGLHAQVPGDTLGAIVAQRDTPQKWYMREHPGAALVQQTETHVKYRNTDGRFVSLFGRGFAYVDPSTQNIVAVDPKLYETDAGWRQNGTPHVVRVVQAQNTTTVELYSVDGASEVSITTNRLTRVGDFTYSFTWNFLTWTLEILPSGWDIRATVPSSKGAAQYQMPLGSSGLNPQPEAGTGDLVSGDFRITRAQMLRADGITTQCSAWSRTAKAIAFTCDDTGFPAAAYPYVIDPTGNYTVAASGDDNYCYGTGTWPAATAMGCTGAASAVILARSRDNGEQEVGFIRWDTSALADNAIVTGASAALYTAVNWADSGNTAKVQWIDSASVWPIGNEDFIAQGSLTGTAYTGDAGGFTAGGTTTLTLTNASTGVSKTGYSALLFGLYRTVAPTGYNQYTISAYDGPAGNRPVLIVTYATPTPRLIVVSQ